MSKNPNKAQVPQPSETDQFPSLGAANRQGRRYLRNKQPTEGGDDTLTPDTRINAASAIHGDGDRKGKDPIVDDRSGQSKWAFKLSKISEGSPGGTTGHHFDHGMQLSGQLPGTSNPNPTVGDLNSRIYWRSRLRNCLPGTTRSKDSTAEAAEMGRVMRELNIYFTSHRQDKSVLPMKPKGFKTKFPTLNQARVVANHFVVHFGSMLLFLYRLVWEDLTYPRRNIPKFVTTALFKKLIDDGQFTPYEAWPQHLVYEGGSVMISPTRFEWIQRAFDLVSNATTVRVNVIFERQIDTGEVGEFLQSTEHNNPREFPEKLVSVGNAIMKQYFRQDIHAQIYFESGRFFFISDEVLEADVNLHSPLLTGRMGYFQSLRLLQGGLTLNVDVMAAAFYKPNIELSEAWQFMLEMGSLMPQEKRDLFYGFIQRHSPVFSQPMADVVNQYWRNLAITSTHRQRRWADEPVKLYTIRRMTAVKADDMTVRDYGDNSETKLMKIMEQKYHLANPGLLGMLPAIQVHKERDHFLPWGCCYTHAGARFPHQLDPRTQLLLQSDVVRRHDSILHWIQNRYTSAIRPGREIHAGTEMRYSLNVDYREMMPVTVLSLRDPQITPPQQDQVVIPANIGELWGILSFVPHGRKKDIEGSFIRMLRERGLERRMIWGENLVKEDVNLNWRGPQTFAAKRDRIRVHIQSLIQQVERISGDRPKPKLNLILCFMERKMSPEYATLKYELDIMKGVPSQVIILPDALKNVPRMLNNVLLKINVKCGGQNFELSDFTKRQMPLLGARTILMGADVTHPGAGEVAPSVAAVVATTDRRGVNYAVRLRAQDIRVERLVQLQEMVQELLQVYRDNEGAYPDNILFFRDGISEKFVLTSLRYEGTAILQAAEALNTTGGYKPKVLIILAIKRHHTRFFVFQNRQRNNNGRDGRPVPSNLPKGSVVIDGVTHPVEYDFFLASHECRIGTCRPTHYHVLLDQIDIQPDDLYTLVYNLCWTFQRCQNKSVSLVTPVYYAHLAAFRAKVYVEFLLANGGRDFRQIDAHVNLRNRLWFL